MPDTYYLMTSDGPVGFTVLMTPDKEFRETVINLLLGQGYLLRAYQGTYEQMTEKAARLRRNNNVSLSPLE